MEEEELWMTCNDWLVEKGGVLGGSEGVLQRWVSRA